MAPPPSEPPWEIDPGELRARMEAGDGPVLLDCRTPVEWEAARIEGARLVPMHEIPARLDGLAPYAERSVVVVCHHGQRSLQVTAFLRQQGFNDVRSLAGGIDRWSIEVDPAVPRY